MDVVWPNQFKLNRFETGLSASVNGAIKRIILNKRILPSCHNVLTI